MKKPPRMPQRIVWLFVTALCSGLLAVPMHAQEKDGSAEDSEIVIAKLTYDGGKTAVCFADQFITTFARETGQNVRRGYVEVALDSDALFEYPFVVFSGQEGFDLSNKEKKNLKQYIERGGFVLASAGCSNNAWASSFETVFEELFGRNQLVGLDTKHALFHTVYDIDHIDVRRPGGRTPIQAMTSEGRVRVLYSPLGLNDTGNAGGDCCCCGGSEIKNARLINVNAMGYALTR
ncbi:MAG: DUF4159 domain-containing protein [Planctomycetota bacterium]